MYLAASVPPSSSSQTIQPDFFIYGNAPAVPGLRPTTSLRTAIASLISLV
jgi:hypothetical protein